MLKIFLKMYSIPAFVVASYLIGLAISGLIFLILNIDPGQLRNNQDLGGWFSIFIHNLSVQAYLILGGLTLGFLTVVIMFINGLVAGFMISNAILTNQVGYLFLNIGAHGLFEMTAVFLSATIGIQIGIEILRSRFQKSFFKYFDKKFILKLCLIISLTLIAAVLEHAIQL